MFSNIVRVYVFINNSSDMCYVFINTYTMIQMQGLINPKATTRIVE